MTFLIAGLKLYAAAAIIAVLASSRAGAWLGLVLAVGLLPLPALLADVHPFARFGLGILAMMLVIRATDLVIGPKPAGFFLRFWHLVALFDTRLATRCTPHFSPARAARTAFFLGLIAVSCAVVIGVSPHLAHNWMRLAVRSLGLVMLLLAMAESLAGALVIAYSALGFSLPSLHDAPHLSRSLNEFWGRRWNRVIGRILFQYGFVPFASRGRAGHGTLAAFVLSAALHAYWAVVAVGWKWALPVGVYFLLQPPLFSLERHLRVRQWPSVAGHAWFWFLFVIFSPLIGEPTFRMLTGGP